MLPSQVLPVQCRARRQTPAGAWAGQPGQLAQPHVLAVRKNKFTAVVMEIN